MYALKIDARVDVRRQDPVEILADAAARDVRDAGREPALEDSLERGVVAAMRLEHRVEERAAADVRIRELGIALQEIADQRVAVRVRTRTTRAAITASPISIFEPSTIFARSTMPITLEPKM